MALHIGKLIDSQIKQQGMTKIALAKRVKTSPQHLHGMIKRPSIDTDMLSRISHALNYNFFSHLSSEGGKVKLNADPRIRRMREEIAAAKEQIEVLTRHNAYLRELLELHNSLSPGRKNNLTASAGSATRMNSRKPINTKPKTSKTNNKPARKKT